ncbi:hypothetical protein D3C81_743290 [compost metagenome]
MASVNLSLHVSFRWWAKPALYAIVLAGFLMKRDVSDAAVDFVCRHGMRLEIVE